MKATVWPSLSAALLAAALLVACGGERPPDRADSPAYPEESGERNSPAPQPQPAAYGPAAQGAPAAPPQPQARGRGLPPGSFHVEPVVVVDWNGFEQPMGAVTLFLPRGWKAQGGVEWGSQHMCMNGYAINWMATSPDGLKSVAILPHDRWEANNMGVGANTPGCRIAPHANIRQYLEAAAQRWLPGSRILDYRQRRDIEKDLAALNSVTPMPMGEIRQWVESGEVLFAFVHQGREMRGALAAAAIFNLNRTSTGMGAGTFDSMSVYVLPMFGATAPDGELDFGFVEAIRRSIKPAPQWDRRIADHNNKIARVAIEEAGKRARIQRETFDEIARIQRETWNSYQESSDRRAREFGELIRGVETYRDADAPGGQVELSHNYDHAWRLNDGSYILTNDTSFDPWRDLNIEGRRLEPVP